ncbi:pentapeptide repeat-containing protein [Paucilactobacillus suebicus]|uniref:Pentapeptide repeat-containing protein n=1 Tax=Paucilactobacillus suebicus DSM 5007 = KCTC 3549 TaxID=1423807 RepID=A0A0R1VXT1_9LACO|nr:pentapeptide repeat-containing protein [Paucilactobacillus suebicus]KRM10197.1 hypothetical protein FD16_GL001468 [Paucilactobacillus suebicus DSM 5007 = KCTC 3549]
MEKEKLQEILDKHVKWLNNELGGVRADLRDADLRCADLRGARLNWANWHEAKNIRVYVAGLQSSRENAQLTYIPSIDVATTGCWQGTWQGTIDRIHSVYADGTRRRKAYDLAIEYIEDQMALDKVEVED